MTGSLWTGDQWRSRSHQAALRAEASQPGRGLGRPGREKNSILDLTDFVSARLLWAGGAAAPPGPGWGEGGLSSEGGGAVWPGAWPGGECGEGRSRLPEGGKWRPEAKVEVEELAAGEEEERKLWRQTKMLWIKNWTPSCRNARQRDSRVKRKH